MWAIVFFVISSSTHKSQGKLLFDLKKIEKDTDRDNFMDANQALEYGLIDEIYEKQRSEE